ncbi:uncharacterized protein VTP21DRAFT_5717 [Calcarisporiella thermophila]|uniref:uncharacterized protein n=1 Tax=Calcarisporiella thermophila TaxID=911321 RepID=UPI00374219D3
MLHELLFAMSGHPGDVFISTPTTFQVTPDFPLLHNSEIHALNRLAHLGFCYFQLSEFIAHTRNRKGFYLQSLSTALHNALGTYRCALLECEKGIISSKSGTLSMLEAEFALHEIVLPALLGLVNEIKDKKVAGCRILDVVADRTQTGVPEIKSVMMRILKACHAVFYQQIAAWMMYGQLRDPHAEFFIREDSREEQVHTGGKLNYVLDKTQIPSHIPMASAESILFSGRVVRIVREGAGEHARSRGGKGGGKDAYFPPSSVTDSHLSSLIRLSHSPAFELSEFCNTIQSIRSSISQWVWRRILTPSTIVVCLESFRHLFLLGRGDFALNMLEELQQLDGKQRVKEHELNALLVRAAVGTLAEDDPALDKLRFVIGENAPEDPKESKEKNVFASMLIGIPIRLTYRLEWPLDLFLGEEELRQYDNLFTYLLVTRRIQFRLQRLARAVSERGRWRWRRQLDGEKSLIEEREKDARQYAEWSMIVWRVRGMMMFFIDAIWGHMQMDVIEVNFRAFLQKVAAAAADTLDFESLQQAHRYYLDNLVRGCLLESQVLRGCLREAFGVCDRFCGIVERVSEDGAGRGEEERDVKAILRLEKEFNRQAFFLFRTLSGVSSGEGPARHLNHLLLRLDFTKWFSFHV